MLSEGANLAYFAQEREVMVRAGHGHALPVGPLWSKSESPFTNHILIHPPLPAPAQSTTWQVDSDDPGSDDDSAGDSGYDTD